MHVNAGFGRQTAGTSVAAGAAAAPPAWRKQQHLLHRHQQQPQQRTVTRLQQRTRTRPQAQGQAEQAISTSQASGGKPMTAQQVALAYYTAYNAKRMDDVLDLIAPDVVYEDLVYQARDLGWVGQGTGRPVGLDRGRRELTTSG